MDFGLCSGNCFLLLGFGLGFDLHWGFDLDFDLGSHFDLDMDLEFDFDWDLGLELDLDWDWDLDLVLRLTLHFELLTFDCLPLNFGLFTFEVRLLTLDFGLLTSYF